MTLNNGESFSLTGKGNLYNYMEVRDGRLVRPIVQDRAPWRQLFNALIILLDFEVATIILIMSSEMNVTVDLLG